MKKTIILALILFCGLSLWGQNANRSGFFVELGANKVFNGPRYNRYDSDINIDGKQYDVYYRLSGLYDLDLGYRLAFARHWAFDIAAGVQTDFINREVASEWYSVCKLIPGFRYTSSEIFANMSLYANAHIHVGYMISYHFEDCNNGFVYGYDVGVGLNFTHAFYGGLIWDASIASDCHWGGLGIKLGYRF